MSFIFGQIVHQKPKPDVKTNNNKRNKQKNNEFSCLPNFKEIKLIVLILQSL